MADTNDTTKAPKAAKRRTHSDVIINKALTCDPSKLSTSERLNTFSMALDRAKARKEYDVIIELAKIAKAAGL